MSQGKEFSYKELVIFSLPSILSSFLEPLASIVDSALVGHIDTSWLAALALATTLFNSFTWIFNFLLHIPTQNLSTYNTQGREDKIGEVFKVALVMALSLGISFSIILYFNRYFLFQLIGADSKTTPQLNSYFTVRVGAQAITLVYLVILSSLRGLSQVNTSFILVFVSTGLNILISYILLYTFNMDISGAAWGTVAANFIGALAGLMIILSHKKRRASFFTWSWPRGVALSFGSSSFNLFLRTLTLTTSFFLATRVASSLGVISLAAHQVALNFWLFSSYFIDGVAITANIRAAQLWGKNDMEKLQMLTRKLVHISVVIGLLFTLSYILLKSFLWKFFTNDHAVTLVLDQIWPWIAFSQVVTSIAYLYDGILFGTSDYSYLKKHMFLGAVTTFLPLLYWGHTHQSLHGIWAGLTLLALYRLFAGFFRVKTYVKGI